MLEFHKRDQAWRPRIAAARTTASAAITQWYARTLGTGKGAAGAWQALALRCPGTEMSDFATAMAYLCAHAGELKNLLVNPGFEHTATGAAAQGRADWDPRKAPPGWSTWAEEPKAARFLWQNGAAAQGKRCVQLAGCRRDACYIQVIPAKPGERYLVRAMARTTSSKSAGTLVRIRWQDAQRGWVVPGRDVFLPLSAGHSGQWEGVFGVATVPPEAGRLVVILAASGHENARDASWFDDVFVCRLPE